MSDISEEFHCCLDELQSVYRNLKNMKISFFFPYYLIRSVDTSRKITLIDAQKCLLYKF